MVLLNDLLEEGATRTAELADNVNAASHAIDELVKRAQALAERVASEGDDAHQEFQAALTALEQAGQELGAAADGADGHLETLAGKAGEVRGRATELLAGVRKAVEELESHKEQLATTLQQRTQAAEQDFERLGEHLEALQTAAEEKLQAADTAVDAFKTALAEALDDVEEAQGRVFDHIQELEDSVWEELKNYAEAIDTGLGGAVEDLVEAANKMVAEHNEAAEAVARKFGEEAVERVTSSFEPLKAAADAVAQLCEDSEEGLASRSSEVLGKVEEALQILERIRPALEAAQKLA
jgi:ABC-type transporter Mla subunit MlaD